MTYKVEYSIKGTKLPVAIDSKPLYVPTNEALSSTDNARVYFHPTCENILSKETEVFKLIRRMASLRLKSLFRDIGFVMFDVGTKNPKKTWNQKVLDTLAPLKQAEKEVRDDVFKIFESFTVEVKNNVDERFIHFKLTKGGTASKRVGEKVYFRAKPQFPYYETLIRVQAMNEGVADSANVAINNITVCKEAVDVVIHLFRCIIPSVTAPDDCEFEVNTPIAARFTAFMQCFAEIADQFNRAQNMFRADMDKAGVYPIDLSWQEMLEDIPDFFRQVPELDYNSHNLYGENEQNNVSIGNVPSNVFSLSSNQPKAVVNTSSIISTPVGVGQPVVVNGQVQQVEQRDIRIINNEQWDFTVPPMLDGDRYVRSEPSFVERRVLHHATTITGFPVIYSCTVSGTFLVRTVINMMQPQPIPGTVPGYGYQYPVQPQYPQPVS